MLRPLMKITARIAAAGLLGLSAPGIARAEDLPPAPVMPGFENVVIGPRPLAAPARPALSTTTEATPSVLHRATTVRTGTTKSRATKAAKHKRTTAKTRAARRS